MQLKIEKMKALDFNVTMQENSIEELFCKKFEQLIMKPMDNNTAKIFIELGLSRDIVFRIPDEEKPFLYKLIEKRVSLVHSFELDDRVLLFLCCICKSAGVGIMYCWYFQYQCKKRNLKKVTFENLAEIFSWGFPSENDLQKLWELQKVNRNNMDDSDNLLDYPQAGKSLF